jgi:preprotein translocase subunit SecD
MFDYPKWKYWLLVIVVVVAGIYALPNLYQPTPAVQISASDKKLSADGAVKGDVEGILIGKDGQKIPTLGVTLENGKVIAKFANVEDQLEAADRLRDAPSMRDKFDASLRLIPTVPKWLEKIHAKGMTLGLDLRGGVQFLLEVDEKVIRETLDRRLTDSIYDVFRRNNVDYSSVVREGDLIIATLANAAEAEKANGLIGANLLELQVGRVIGSALEMSIRPEVLNDAFTQSVTQNITTLRDRLGALAEPVVQRQGQSRILVQLPGEQDPSEVKIRISATASLEYRAVDEENFARSEEVARTGNVPAQSALFKHRDGRAFLLRKQVIASGSELTNAAANIDPQSGEPMVEVTLTSAAGSRMLDFTAKNVGKRMAVVYVENKPVKTVENGKEITTFVQQKTVISEATVQGVFGNRFRTTGLSSDEAKELATSLDSGSLSAPMVFAQERVIGPSLGKKNIERGLLAVGASFVFVLIFFCIYYKTFGLITGAALIVNLLLVVALMSAGLGSTLTLPGLAGLALTIGMSVDANVLINERIREELRRGISPLQAIDIGYDKASGTIWDANITALLGGLALFAFGSGPIQGFAITLCLGILTSVYTAVSFSKGVAAFVYGGRKIQKLSI